MLYGVDPEREAIAALLERARGGRGCTSSVDVEIEGRMCQGRTVVDVENLTGEPPNAAVMNDLDHDASSFSRAAWARPDLVEPRGSGKTGDITDATPSVST